MNTVLCFTFYNGILKYHATSIDRDLERETLSNCTHYVVSSIMEKIPAGTRIVAESRDICKRIHNSKDASEKETVGGNIERIPEDSKSRFS